MLVSVENKKWQQYKNSFIIKNVTVNKRRTSLRLERASWLALEDICQFESLSLHELCSLVERQR